MAGKAQPVVKSEKKPSIQESIILDTITKIQKEMEEIKVAQTNLPAPVSIQQIYDLMEYREQMTVRKDVRKDEDFDGLSFKFSGKYDADKLSKKLNKVLAMVEGEDSLFEINFSLKEKPNVMEAVYQDVTIGDDLQPLKIENEELKERIAKLEMELAESKKKKIIRGNQVMKR